MAAKDDEVRWAGQQAVIATPAEIDVTNTDGVRQALLTAASLGPPVLIIDMSRTTFCDSAGVQAIIATYRQAKGTRTQVRLVATTVLRILTLVGADQLIPIYPTLEAALAEAPGAEADSHGTGAVPASADPADPAAAGDT